MGFCSPCGIVHSILSFLQVALAIAIVVVVGVELVDVDVQVTDKIDTQYTCLLGQDVKSGSLCTYTFIVCGLSLALSLAVSLLQCCTCNLCGLGGIIDIIFAAVGTVWWGVASGVIGANATDDLVGVGPATAADVQTARDAVPIMCWVQTGLFALMLVSSIFACCGKCGGGRK